MASSIFGHSHGGQPRTGARAMELGRWALMVLCTALLLIAGVRTSWDTAQHAMFTKGREQGTMTVERCGAEECTGRFVPAKGKGTARGEVTTSAAVAREAGDSFPVAVRPGTERVVRTGTAGILHAWLPFAGSLLLAALLVAGGLRLPRTGWALGLLGGLLMGGMFLTL